MTSSPAPVSSVSSDSTLSPLVLQGFTAPLALSDFKLAAFDMDSTLISIECIDEIAAAAGRKDEVAAITEAAMRGEITDFKDSLRRRVALLEGVTVADMEQVYTERDIPGLGKNVLTEEAPGIRLCFNTTPEDTVEALRRWIQA